MPENFVMTSFWGKLFSPLKKIKFTNEIISFEYKNGAIKTFKYSELANFPEVEFSIFGAILTLHFNEEKLRYSMLDKMGVSKILEILDRNLTESLSLNINNLKQLYDRYAVKEFLRDSSIIKITATSKELIENYRKSSSKWKQKLNKESILKLEYLSSRYPFETNKNVIREEYEKTTLIKRKEFYDKIESNPLTEQQRSAVIRNNDLNLVLAAAGTGKTSVMVAKALDLIDSGMATSDEILILAYNNAAAKELEERLLHRSEIAELNLENKPIISTFHALGRKILRDSKINTSLSEFVDDPKKLEMWVSKWLGEYISKSPTSLFKFLELSYQPVNPFDFKTKAEYDAYIRDNEYRTLQGERVRGYQELLIANWLFLHSVPYEYEAAYKVKRRIEEGVDYHPDFYLSNTNIYLEHFGIDRQGKTRPDIDRDKYNQEIRLKRELHKENGTILIETYHYDWQEGALEERLKTLMDQHNIPLIPKNEQEIFDALKNLGILAESAKRYLKCLQAIRVERLDKNSILQRLKDSSIFHANKYTELLEDLHQDYRSQLRKEDAIDFDDMIIRSTELITNKTFTPKWKYILVDEFQDISMARMDLIKSLITYGPSPILTVVGDDWQSIYRFSGGKLELTTRFGSLVGTHSLTKLEKTYRYNNSIAKVAGLFVMQNPEQYKKEVITHTQVNSSQVFLLDSSGKSKQSLDERVIQVIRKIKENDSDGSIAILARYRYLLDNARERVKLDFKDLSKFKFWTFHGSKGLEADYCILVGFFQGKTGFPNQNKEEAVVEALLPSLDSYPHSEERRLLYVAITRARKKCYIIADAMAPSEFINELIAPKFDVYIASEKFKETYRAIFKCPKCSAGYLKLYEGKFGSFYSCTSGSICKVSPRICEKCGSPSIDHRNSSICNNINCRHEMMICDKCGRPMKLREGKFGKFWGCSGYGIKNDKCENTRKHKFYY